MFRRRSSSIWMPRMTRCTASKKAGSSTVIMTATVICRSTSSAAGICWRRSCGGRDIDGAAGAVEEVARIVAQIRQCWPRVRILLRGNSGFAREALMAWCETNRARLPVRHGTQRTPRRGDQRWLIMAAAESIATGKPARRFKDFTYSTLDSWSRSRRVIGKAEVTGGDANPRFVVTSLKPAEVGGQHLYEKIYCARGEMENRIKECQLDRFADRTSTATMRAQSCMCTNATLKRIRRRRPNRSEPGVPLIGMNWIPDRVKTSRLPRSHQTHMSISRVKTCLPAHLEIKARRGAKNLL